MGYTRPVTLPAAPTKPPQKPKFPRGGFRELAPSELEDESSYRGRALEGLAAVPRRLESVAFEGCVFREVDFSGVVWTRVRCADVRFEQCNFTGAVWREVSLDRVEFVGDQLLGLQAPEVRLRHVRFSRVRALLSLWFQADAKQVWVEDSDFSEAMFREARLPGVVFRACRLAKADFTEADLSEADLRGSELNAVRLTLRELAGVTVTAVQLLDLAHLLNVRIAELP